MDDAATPPVRRWRTELVRFRHRLAVVKPLLGGRWRTIVAISGLSTLGGVTQALTLVLIVRVGVELAQGAHSASLTVGPVALGTLSTTQLLWLACAFAVVTLVSNVYTVHLAARLSTRVLATIRIDGLLAYTEAQWATQHAEGSGRFQELMSVYTFRGARVVLFVSSWLVAAINLVALLVGAFLIDPAASLGIAAALGALLVIIAPLAGRTKRYSRRAAAAGITFAEGTSEVVALARDIRTNNVEREVRLWTDRIISDVSTPYYRTNLLQRLVPTLIQYVGLILLLIGLAVVARIGGTITDLGAVILLLLRALTYAQSMQTSTQGLNEALPYISAYEKAVASYRRAAVSRGGAPLASIDHVHLEDVCFEYVPGQRALEAVGLDLRRGCALGIVGASGSGKSTLVQILLRLRQPTAGRMLVNGTDAESYSLDDWYGRVAFVPQDPTLLTGTIRDNIAFFRSDVTDEDIHSAARAANIHEEILAMPAQYATFVGHGGSALSGGQRQRVAIARALLKHPDLLILDEPTSALDLVSEDAVKRSLAAVKGRTAVVVIAHRLSTLDICDDLLVLSGGVVEARGKASDLRSRAGFFQDATRLSQET